ncbi:MAG TPA: F0F1 ATP synthase subunit A [Candidatus Didemnitutus sp.]|jgi:F-type H+-transporting ATPase subunit a
MMLHTNKILGAFLGLGLACVANASEGVAPKAEALFHAGPFPITNSMVTSWVVAVALIVAVRLAIKTPTLVPSRGQAIVESLVSSIYDLVAPIVGKNAIKAAFPVLIGLFTYILIQNWSGLVPGVGTVFMKDARGGWMEFVRPAHADMNGTIALALVAITTWLVLILRFAGPKMILYDLFGNKADRREIPALIYYFLFIIFFAVGVIEVISIIFRPVSLSFRLYGNVLGGENLLHAMSSITRWGLPIPFYFLEVLIGFVQAFVFTLLVSVYIGLLCNHGDDQHGADAGHGAQPASH